MNAYESTMNFTRRAVWAQIDLDAAAHNMRQIRKLVGPDVRIAAVVKANAYGHGSVELARTFAEMEQIALPYQAWMKLLNYGDMPL